MSDVTYKLTAKPITMKDFKPYRVFCLDGKEIFTMDVSKTMDETVVGGINEEIQRFVDVLSKESNLEIKIDQIKNIIATRTVKGKDGICLN